MNEGTKGKLKRGVSLYSYSGLYGVSMELEDCLMDIQDMGATCVEILSSHIDNYPCPTAKWVDEWWRLMDKYHLEPGGYGHWCDTMMYKNRDYTSEEALNNLIRDFRLAYLLGFKCLRTKITIKDDLSGAYGAPETGWQEYVKRALVYAEKYDVRMCTEIHRPTSLRDSSLEQYFEFIEKTRTKHFGFNIDFGTYQNKLPDEARVDELAKETDELMKIEYSNPEDMIRFLPYTYYCHAKFNYVNEKFEEVTIPYADVLNTMIDNGWSGCLVSEYEGPNKEDPDFVPEQLRRQHIMMKQIIGY